MERRLEVPVNCGEFSCDDCGYLCHAERGDRYWCDLFGEDPVDRGDGPERTQVCLDAERKQDVVSE